LEDFKIKRRNLYKKFSKEKENNEVK